MMSSGYIYIVFIRVGIQFLKISNSVSISYPFSLTYTSFGRIHCILK